MSDRIVYGNITEPSHPGFLGLGMGATAMAVAGVLLGGICLFLGQVWIAAGFLAAGLVGAFWLSMGKKHGRSTLEKAINKRGYRKAVRKGTTAYLSGPASDIPDGSFRAPGLLAGTVPMSGVDSFGHPFGMLWNPRKQTGTVFFACAGEGVGLLDQGSIDSLVDGWAGYLQHAGSSADLLQLSVTTQTTRDAGERLPAAVAAGRAKVIDPDGVPFFARATVDEIVAMVNAGVPRVEQHIAATFSAGEIAGEGIVTRTADDMLADLGTLLPGTIEFLQETGAGTVSRLQIQDITDYAFVAYNPDRALMVERARLTTEGTGLSWYEVGPQAARALTDRYAHGGYVSRSLQMWKPPAGVFHDNSLAALLGPDGVADQKRVTILYRPLGPEESAARIQTAVKNKMFEINQKGHMAEAAQKLALQKVSKAAGEQAAGAALVRFSILATVTVPDGDPELLKRAEAAVRRACSQGVQLSLRPADHSQDSAHAIGLGLGLVPAQHAALSQSLREAL